MSGIILKICQVMDVYDDADGERIKVRLSPEDDKLTDDRIPYVYPLLPKLLHVKPKIDEYVLVVLTEAGNGYSNRYYIGPIISQPQFMDDETFGYTDASGNTYARALSLYPKNKRKYDIFKPDVAPSTNPDSHGALAKDEDIAIYGRKKNDIIISDDDIKIRSGSRLKDNNVKGRLVYNRLDPAFIQLKHTDNKNTIPGDEENTYRSTATIVADKINLISHQSKTPFRTTNGKQDLITDDVMQEILEKAHQLPYGDILVEFLKLFVNAFALHTHPYPGLAPCATPEFVEATTYDLNKILSESVRIN